jgi:hypothetical protein
MCRAHSPEDSSMLADGHVGVFGRGIQSAAFGTAGGGGKNLVVLEVVMDGYDVAFGLWAMDADCLIRSAGELGCCDSWVGVSGSTGALGDEKTTMADRKNGAKYG